MKDESSEALIDRLIAIQVPYNVRVGDGVKIYGKMLSDGLSQSTHLAPLTLASASTLAVLSRLEPPARKGLSLLDKLRVYEGQIMHNVSADDVRDMRRHHPDEGMEGLSPSYVMNRLSAALSEQSTGCLSPLKALDVLWNGLKENVSLDPESQAKYLGFLRDSVREYGNRAVRDIQRAYKEGFEASAKELLDEYLGNVEAYCEGRDCPERDMRDLEKNAGIYERNRSDFRQEINGYFSNLKSRGIPYDHTSEDRLKAAIEAKLFPTRQTIERTVTFPRSVPQRA